MIKAFQVGAPATLDNLKWVDLEDPAEPKAGEIRVRLQASSLNYHDYAVVEGLLPAAEGRIPLSDAAGIVEAVGEGVSDFAVGDMALSLFFPEWVDGLPPPDAFARVPGDGYDGYAREVIVAPASWFTRAPKGYSAAEAATLTCAGLTAWRALFVDSKTGPQSTVLIQGTGGVSIFALQLAKMAGARVIATSSSAAKLERLKDMGADHLINYREVDDWGAKALEYTEGRGVDTVVEIGGPGTLDQSMVAARAGGHIALIGVLTGFAGAVNTGLLMMKNLRVQGLTVGSRTHQLELIAAVENGGMKPIIDRHFPLEQLADAFRYQLSGQHFGKICVDIGG